MAVLSKKVTLRCCNQQSARAVQKAVTSDISIAYHYHDFMGSLPNFIILGYVLGHVGPNHRHF